jgi:hypothetical protein
MSHLEDNYYDGKNNFKDNYKFYGQNKDGSYFLKDGTKEYLEREQQERDKNYELTKQINRELAKSKEERKILPHIALILAR